MFLIDGCTTGVFLDDKKLKSKVRVFRAADNNVLSGSSLSLSSYESQLSSLSWMKDKSYNGFLKRSTCWLTRDPCICSYAYGNKMHPRHSFPVWLEDLTKQVANIVSVCPSRLNSCNLNRYDNWNQHLEWHSDNEKPFRRTEFQRDTLIISLSLGATRTFSVRIKGKDAPDPTHMNLHDGDVITMEGLMQDKYDHKINRGVPSDVSEPRVNLTWRETLRHTKECPSN